MRHENLATMTTAVGTITLDSHGNLLSFDTACEGIFGLRAAQAIGKHISILMDSSSACEFDLYMTSIFSSPADTVASKGFELLGQRQKGDTFFMHLSVGLLAAGGERCLVCLVADVSERKVIEKHRDHFKAKAGIAATEVNAIVQTAVSAIVTMDGEGAIKLFNPAAETLFGWSADEVVGEKVTVLMPSAYAVHHDSYVQRYLDTSQAHIVGIGREIVAQRKDGSTFPAQLEVGDAKLGYGEHLFVAFIYDISAQKQAEEELISAKNEAEAAARTKASFLATMSHEIRTPMNAVIGFAEIALQDTAVMPTTHRHIQTIHNAAQRLLGIINDVLDFSKIEAGKVVLEVVCFHLPNAVQETLQTMAFRAKEKGLVLTFNVAHDLPLRFVGDPTRLCQVILNLVDNAIKFTDEGEITVAIDLADEPGMIHFSVSDTGVGMTPEQSVRIFESFSQADNTTARRFGGTGLGTTISKQIVEMMKGKIWLETTLGRGSTFHFDIKIPVAVEVGNCLYEHVETAMEVFVSPRKFNVLLAEDLEVNAILVTLRLEQQGHSVTWVKDGKEAVDHYNTAAYDLVLMDIQMPRLGGIAATALIREQEEKSGAYVPIIALTASVMKEDQYQFIESGMDAVVGKPIDFETLFRVMDSVVPQGMGKANHSVTLSNRPSTVSIDFSFLNGLADAEKALLSWCDPLLYAKALLKFADEQRDDGVKMIASLEDSPDDKQAVQYMAHALKGLAANLALTDVHDLAAQVDVLLNTSEHLGLPALLSHLDSALMRVCSAIEQLQLPGQVTASQQVIDANVVNALLQKLLVALDQLNPEVAAPVLKALTSYFSVADLLLVQQALDGFDFDAAKEATELLIQSLGLGE